MMLMIISALAYDRSLSVVITLGLMFNALSIKDKLGLVELPLHSCVQTKFLSNECRGVSNNSVVSRKRASSWCTPVTSRYCEKLALLHSV